MMTVSDHQFLNTDVITDHDSDSTVEANVLSGSGTLFAAEVDNSANASQDVYFKIWDATSVTLGSDDPDYCFRIDAGAVRRIIFGLTGEGRALATGLSFGVFTEAGTPSSTSPTNKVKTTICAS